MRELILLSNTSRSPFSTLFDKYTSWENADWNKVDKNTFIHYGGGTDVNPNYYHEKRNGYTQEPDLLRDKVESTIFHKVKDKIGGFIGICRGSQFLTVMNGGKLVQDIGFHHAGSDHSIAVGWENDETATLRVTSTHHQMMFPFNLKKDEYEILGATGRKGLRYLNGDGDNIIDKVPFDVEIVWYPKTRSLCIQGHPEYMAVNMPFPKYTRFLVDKYLFGNTGSKPESFDIKRGDDGVLA